MCLSDPSLVAFLYEVWHHCSFLVFETGVILKICSLQKGILELMEN